MPYYTTGDYATGGYYQGDPGLGRLFKRIIKVGRKVLPFAASFIPGVGGLVAGGLAAAASRRIAPRPRVQYEPTQYPSFPGTGLQPSFPTFRGPPDPMSGRYGPGAKIPVTAGQVCCPPGTHPAKDGSGRCVTNRRMNPLNPRALRRAIRRQDGFARLAKRMGYVKRKGR